MNVDPAEDTTNPDKDVAPASNREPVEEDTPLASVKQPEGGQEGKERSSGRVVVKLMLHWLKYISSCNSCLFEIQFFFH